MSFAIVQKDLAPPAVLKLEQAFRSVPFLTAVDAVTLTNDAFGILVKGLTSEQAASVHAALTREGIETELVDERELPAMPPTKFVNRLDCRSEGLIIYDPLGRSFTVDWGHLMLIAAGAVRLSVFRQAQRPVLRTRFVQKHRSSCGIEHETVTREERQSCLCLELVLTRGVQRFSARAEQFRFDYLAERKTGEAVRNLGLLVQDLTRLAPGAAVNRGAQDLLGNAAEPFTYPSKNAFHEEITWLMWQNRH